MLNNREAVFNELVKQNHASIYRICRAYLYNQSHADDLYQEILYQVWSSLATFKGNAQVSTWVYRVAVNTAISYNVKQKRHQHSSLPDGFNPPQEDSSGVTQEKETQLSRLRLCIQQLPEHDRLIISLVLEDKSYKEIADILGSSTNLVGVKINRIKGRLLKCIQHHTQNEF